MQGECRSQVYLDYAEPRGVEAHEVWLTAADFAETRSVCELGKIVQGECRNQVYLDYAEPRGVEAHEVWLTAADFAETRSVCELGIRN